MGILEGTDRHSVTDIEKALLFMYATENHLPREQQYRFFGLISGLSEEEVNDAFEGAIANGWAEIREDLQVE